MNRDNIGSFISWALFIAFCIWLYTSLNEKKPQYIKEQFQNGRSIEVPVDNSITRDNWECTGDCSGHEAGYEWAMDQGISDPSDCGGNSESFIEGCEAYANEQDDSSYEEYE